MRLLIALVLTILAGTSHAATYDVTKYGAVPNDAGDDGAAIQGAIDACQAKVTSSTGAGVVLFPAGRYDFGSPLVWKSCSLVGESSPNVGVRLNWNGNATATAITKSRSPYAGGVSFGELSGIELLDIGGPGPGTWLHLAAGSWDVGLRLRNMHFAGGERGIASDGWSNAYIEDVRFDGQSQWAIDLTAAAGQNLSSFSLEDFTWDNGGATAGPRGFLRVNNPSNTGSAGIVAISHARLEMNVSLGGHGSIIEIHRTCSGGCSAASLQLDVEDVTVDDAAGNAADTFIYMAVDGGAAYARDDVRLRNVRVGNVAKLIGGMWPPGLPLSNIPSAGNIAYLQLYNDGQFQLRDLDLEVYRSSANYRALATRAADADTFDRFDLFAAGRQCWGPGNLAVDTCLTRRGVGALGVEAGDTLGTAPTDAPPACSAAIRGQTYFDASRDEPCVCKSAGWQQMDGGGSCL